MADWVGLQESADFGAVVSGAIVIQATLAVKPPAGEIVWIADDADGPALAVRAFWACYSPRGSSPLFSSGKLSASSNMSS